MPSTCFFSKNAPKYSCQIRSFSPNNPGYSVNRTIFFEITSEITNLYIYIYYIPAYSKWPFDNPNGGHQQPFKGSRELTIPKKATKQNCQDTVTLFSRYKKEHLFPLLSFFSFLLLTWANDPSILNQRCDKHFSWGVISVGDIFSSWKNKNNQNQTKTHCKMQS